MAYFRRIEKKLDSLLTLLKKDERWLILMNADPDALASAMALKRILARRVAAVGLAQVNEITRPDNLAMIRYLRIPARRLTPTLAAQYDCFALVDSQPHHHPDLSPFSYSIVIDHHPFSDENPVHADFKEIKPEYGATSTLLTEYLYNLKLRPGKLLATALLYGIKTDTRSFERNFTDADIKAFRYLSKFADQMILRKIVRSEFRLEWLKYFSQAMRKMRIIGSGMIVCMGEVDSTDILVILADFFLRVHEISWTVVSGISDDTLVTIFRGDGVRRDMGKLAEAIFGDIGTAGGHKAMARAELPVSKLKGRFPGDFIWDRLRKHKCSLPGKTQNTGKADS
ncbi:MAG: DHH family phosphoesterase [Desulfovibrionales bacterium]